MKATTFGLPHVGRLVTDQGMVKYEDHPVELRGAVLALWSCFADEVLVEDLQEYFVVASGTTLVEV